jgi:hypothetical protein
MGASGSGVYMGQDYRSVSDINYQNPIEETTRKLSVGSRPIPEVVDPNRKKSLLHPKD